MKKLIIITFDLVLSLHWFLSDLVCYFHIKKIFLIEKIFY